MPVKSRIIRVSAVFAALVLLATLAACGTPLIDNRNTVTVTSPAPAPVTATSLAAPAKPKKATDRTVIRDQRAVPAVADGKFYDDAKPAK